MIKLRKSEERGHIDHGWLNTFHSFSFSNYYDPAHMGFRSLRVINEDTVIGGEGFDTHSHKDMEIITYVLQGALEHKDSMGNGSVITPGEVQYMAAGTGVSHSEKNPSSTESVHLLQIWILPESHDLKPCYDQKNFKEQIKPGNLTLVCSHDGSLGSIKVHQDIKLFVGRVDQKASLSYDLNPSRFGWLQITSGKVMVNNTELNAGDGAEISKDSPLKFSSSVDSEFLLFDLN